MLGSVKRNLMWLAVSVLIISLAGSAFGASTGQIKGLIKDKETGEPIIGATVQVMGANRGAFTDTDGKYTVPRVEPGTYNLRVTTVGYNTLEIEGVVVRADLTVAQDAEMTKEAADLGLTIKVIAKHDPIDRFVTDNRIMISKETIDRQPVTTVDDLVSQVAGVITDQAGDIYIRGGRAGEVAYIVDGVPLGDPLGGQGQAGAAMSLVSGSIQEFTIIKDGFDPEYGDALSGIVKITTQTGSKDHTSLNLQFITDDFGNETLNKYSRNSDYLRVSLKGPDNLFSSKILPALGLTFLEDKEFTYYLYGEVDKNDGIYQYDDYDTPNTKRDYGSFNLLGLDIPERLINKYYWMANFKFRPRQNLKLIFSYKQSETRGTYFTWGYRYSSATAAVYKADWRSMSLEIAQTLSKDMSYEAIISYTENGYEEKPGDPNNPGHGLDPDQFLFDYEWESFDDTDGDGVWDAPEPLINLYPDTTRYGDDFSGADYTFGEGRWVSSGGGSTYVSRNHINLQGNTTEQSNFRFNDNGELDNLEGEPYLDLNGNGLWDQGEYLRDVNGNGILDANRVSPIDNRSPEPYIDGDSIIGEPFTDNNANGVYDADIDEFIRLDMDLNRDGQYNGPLDRNGNPANWSVGVPYQDRNGNGVYDRPNFKYDPGEPFTDMNGNGKWDGGGSSNFLDPGNYGTNATWHYRRTTVQRAELKLFRQFGPHEFKLGGLIKKWDFTYQDIRMPYREYNSRADGGPFPDRGAFRDVFAYNPWGGTFYFRDKLEYGSMIASLGLRWDFFIQDTEDLKEIARNDDLGSGVILGDRQKLSPRIGFSYPISDKAKVHFNYGHFFQLPELRWMYARNTSNIDLDDVIGNYNLDYKKTVQYSFGVKYAMSETYSIDVSGYFKDEFDKVNNAQVFIGGLTRQQYQNSDYGRSRGFELQLEKRTGGYVNGMISYVYSFAFGKASQANENYLTLFELSRTPLSEAALDNDVRHVIKSSIQVFIPNTVRPRLFGLAIPNGWSMSLLTTIQSGKPFTPDKTYPDLVLVTGENPQTNSLRMPSTFNVDARFSKEFKMVALNWRFIAWVENIFDNKNVNGVYGNTGRPDTRQNFDQIIKGGTDYDLNPSNWNFGRQVRAGLEVDI